MNSHPVNEFLPAAARQRPNMDEIEEDEIDMARFSAIRKEQKEELERLDHHHHTKQLQIENQIRAELDQLFNHFQQGMQSLYTGLTQTVNTTVEVQVKLRIQQERLREEHATNKREVERRYHNEASRLVMSTSQVARHTQSLLRAPSSSLPAGVSGIPVSLEKPRQLMWMLSKLITSCRHRGTTVTSPQQQLLLVPPPPQSQSQSQSQASAM